MKIILNSDNKEYASLWHYNRLLEKMGLLSDDGEIALNICSISNKGLVRGRMCTVYIEGDECFIKGSNKDIYKQADINYICNKRYLSYYPEGTRVLKSGVYPDWHYLRDVKKNYDYVFIASTRCDPVYNNRKELIEKLDNHGKSILRKECPPMEYPEQMSRGKVILNILPRNGDDASGNYRLLEGCAIGTLMTDWHEVVDDLGLIPNVHYLPIERFGENFSDEELKRIHEVGRKHVCENFSYRTAIETIINDAEAFMKTT